MPSDFYIELEEAREEIKFMLSHCGFCGRSITELDYHVGDYQGIICKSCFKRILEDELFGKVTLK